jgi:hypothetical protein
MDLLCITLDKCLEYNNKKVNDELTLSLALVVSTLDRLKWLVIYLFILEMRSVQITLISESLEEFKKNMKSHNRIWWFIVTYFIVLQIPIVVVQYVRKFGIKTKVFDEIDKNVTLELVELILRSLKMPVDIYMFVLYMRLLHFFI